ncbi:MAG: hypothetical protein PUF61_07860 [Spirochaetales bacterium]|nr:hypothetical protein [Spirochaetales bacterium]
MEELVLFFLVFIIIVGFAVFYVLLSERKYETYSEENHKDDSNKNENKTEHDLKKSLKLTKLAIFILTILLCLSVFLRTSNNNIHKTGNIAGIEGEWKYEIKETREGMPVKLTMLFSFKDGEYIIAISLIGAVNSICRGTYTESGEEIKLNFPKDFFDLLEGKWSKIPKSLINDILEYDSYNSLPIENTISASFFFKDKNTLVLTDDTGVQTELKRCSNSYINKIIK